MSLFLFAAPALPSLTRASRPAPPTVRGLSPYRPNPMLPEGCNAISKCTRTFGLTPLPKTYYVALLKGQSTEWEGRSSLVIPFYPMGFSNKRACRHLIYGHCSPAPQKCYKKKSSSISPDACFRATCFLLLSASTHKGFFWGGCFCHS